MEWAEFKDAVRSVITDLLGTTVSGVHWRNEQKPIFDIVTKCDVTLELLADRKFGEDEIREEFDANADLLNLIVVGYRVSTISVQAECLSHHGSEFAFRRLADVRDKLDWQSTLDVLKEAGLGVVGVSDITVMPNFIIDDREYSKANLDLQFSYMLTRPDENYDGSYIKRVEITSPFKPYQEPTPMIVDADIPPEESI